jgi:ubiquinone/menaquinone biosynthesis C-methylase UbiE
MNINSEIYNFWFNKSGIYNSELYEKVFKKIPKNSKILYVGIGTGFYLTNCANIIKEKNISIDGIDIDEEYIKSCKNEIKKNSLGKYVKAHTQNLLTYKLEQFDYVIFIQSYPVIYYINHLCHLYHGVKFN